MLKSIMFRLRRRAILFRRWLTRADLRGTLLASESYLHDSSAVLEEIRDLLREIRDTLHSIRDADNNGG